uniref:Uncharacterized protein n=1 Tax=Anguilla anguilla TaxID=7936 RepID=A0A0E9ULQ1_ANGAN
MNSSICKNCF